ncbi:hypothetical protein [Mesoplasma chauliocola]|uniref:hypothetical protein n=1 Tax=Mesoplasma chauliocola TaxID=216427 RepID=UPI0012EC9AC9|nr:hypothetical protein [Mesoplasma chauliocola]
MFTKSILIEIGFADKKFYIGDQEYFSIPNSVIENSYSSANWNRTLKYKISNQELDKKYYMLDVEVYWDLHKNNIKFTSKIFFFNNILNSNNFLLNFANVLFSHYFKHTLTFDENKNIDIKFIEKYKPEISRDVLRINKINNFVIFNNKFEFEDKKFKQIWLISEKEFSWKINKQNQIIYTIPKKVIPKELSNNMIDFVNLETGIFYLNSKSKLNNKLVLELSFPETKIAKIISEEIINIIKKSNDKYKNWHLFNLTNDFNYIQSELDVIEKSGKNIEVYLKNVYKELKRNYKNEINNKLISKY